ncbi:MAG: 3-deoxy-7-phosphoheptulonate synthase [Candidatus Paceibacterota bacterium]
MRRKQMTTLANAKQRTQLRNRRIVSKRNPMTPRQAHEQWPLTQEAMANVSASQQTVIDILNGVDRRMLVICGPCSAHSKEQMTACGEWVQTMQKQYGNKMFFVLRFCVEKPRSTTGWEGLIFDPHFDDSRDENEGVRLSREIGLVLAENNVPLAMEYLHTDTAQMLDDLVTVAWIGARTVSSPNIRRFAGGVSMPIGFKNGESGSLVPAIQAITTAGTPEQEFRSIDDDGVRAFFQTAGNADTFLILRGGTDGSNATPEGIADATKHLAEKDLPQRIVVDCAHKNKSGGPDTQSAPFMVAVNQRVAGAPVLGVMLEVSTQEHGSRTDPCATTEQASDMLEQAYEALGE